MSGYSYESLVFSAREGCGRRHLLNKTYPAGIDCDSAEKWMSDYGVVVMHWEETSYHFKLSGIVPQPLIVYALGDVGVLDKKILGVVGPRNPSMYITTIMKEITKYLPLYDLVTISGGASGVDTILHEQSIALGVPTILILGYGLRLALKGRIRNLIRRIVGSGGLVLSDFPLDQDGRVRTFPMRNRIIAGLCDRLFIPGAGLNSGTMNTFDHAKKMGKYIYTVPGSIRDASSEGTNKAIAQSSCFAVTDLETVFEGCFNKTCVDSLLQNSGQKLSVNEKKVMELIGHFPTVDQLGTQLGRDLSVLLTTISLLEMSGYIIQERPGVYNTIFSGTV